MSEAFKASDFPNFIGKELEPSSWMEITQERINQFADATNDHQFIHVDPVKAAQTPFGGPIAHGFLTLSLTVHLMEEHSLKPEGLIMGINYGSDKVRFLQPVPVGSRVRAHQKILDAAEKNPGQWLIKTALSIEIEHFEKPAMIAEILLMYIVK